MRPVGLDLETFLFGPEHGSLPPPVCASLAWRDDDGEVHSWLVAACEPEFDPLLEGVLRDPEALVVGANVSFDLGVLARRRPALAPAVYDAVHAGRVRDVQIRERLLRISTVGEPDEEEDEEGGTRKVKTSLADLVLAYTGRDRFGEKEDGWRLRYAELAALKAAEYPEEARAYAMQDAVDALLVFEGQLRRPGTTATEELHCAAALALAHATDAGMALDPGRTRALHAGVRGQLEPATSAPLMLAAGILRPGHDGQPYANGSQDHAEGCDGSGCACAGFGVTSKGNRRHARGCPRPRCACPPRMTAPEAPSIDEARLHERVLEACARADVEVALSDGGVEARGAERLPAKVWSWDPSLRDPKSGKPRYVSTGGDFLHELAALDDALAEYRLRKRLQKAEAFLARCLEAVEAGHPSIHPNYSILKASGRTSAWGARRGAEVGSKDMPLPSLNVQQVPNPPKVKREGMEFLQGLDVRSVFEPRPGTVYVNADYSSLELVTVAQVTHNLFGDRLPSRHREIINSGRNCHTYLGAQILYERGDARDPSVRRFREDADVRAAVRRGDRTYLHDAFARYSTGTDAERKCFKRYRNTAKPVGLGFPGGLGPRKMAYKIFPQYDLEATVEECQELRMLWLDAYPEMRAYFRHVQETLLDPATGLHWYEFAGFERRACTYTAAANGGAMQTPGAFVAKMALAMLDRAIHDPSARSILYGAARLVGFFHDEVLLEVPDDAAAHDRAEEVGRIMVEAEAVYCPDVRGEAVPLLTRRWCKDAEPRRDAWGRLVSWEPKE